MDYASILIRPLDTEKTRFVQEEANQVAFYVSPRANKIEVKRAVEEAFKVKVTEVRIVRRQPIDRRRQGRVVGTVSGYKKAYVTLAEGQTIDLFEGV